MIVQRATALLAAWRRSRWLLLATYLVVFGAGAAFFAARFARDLSALRSSWHSINWLYIGLAFGLYNVCLVVQAGAWYGIVRLLDGRISFLQAVRFYGLTLLPRYVPGSILGYTSRTLLLERHGVPVRVSVKSTLLEVGLIVASGALVGAYRLVAPPWFWLLAGALAAAFAAWLKAPRMNPIGKMPNSRYGGWLLLGLVYVIFWVLYGMSTWLVSEAVAPAHCAPCAVDIAASTALAWLGGFAVVFVPGGLGVREALLTVLLAPSLGAMPGALVSVAARVTGMAAEGTFSLVSSAVFQVVATGPEGLKTR